MFRDSATLRHHASEVFAEFSLPPGGSGVLSPHGYRQAYFILFGVMPTPVELEAAFVTAFDAGTYGGRALSLRDRLEAQLPTSGAPPPGSCPGIHRIDFVNRVEAKYAAIYGPYANQRDSLTFAALPSTDARLWALFDSLDPNMRGFITAGDIESAVVLAAAGPHGALLSPADKRHLRSVFTLCDEDGDGRVHFDDFRKIFLRYLQRAENLDQETTRRPLVVSSP